MIFVAFDEFLIDTYQRLIGDPLQARGVCLMVQWRIFAAAFGAGAWYEMIAAAANDDFLTLGMNGVVLLLYLQWAFWPDDIRKMRLKPNSAGTRNPFRTLPSMRALRIGIAFMAIFVIVIDVLLARVNIGTTSLVSFLLMHLADASDPKPPKPKRLPFPHALPETA